MIAKLEWTQCNAHQKLLNILRYNMTWWRHFDITITTMCMSSRLKYSPCDSLGKKRFSIPGSNLYTPQFLSVVQEYNPQRHIFETVYCNFSESSHHRLLNAHTILNRLLTAHNNIEQLHDDTTNKMAKISQVRWECLLCTEWEANTPLATLICVCMCWFFSCNLSNVLIFTL